MTAKTFRQLREEGTVKRADAMKVRLADIHEEPGFNLRDLEGVDLDGVTFQDGIDALCEFILGGGQVPPLEVRPRDKGGVWLVDGHRRRLALLQAVEQGYPEANEDGELWVSVVPFNGDEDAREARIFTSNKNRGLTDLEMARGCKRYADRGRKPDEIAKAIGMTRQRVDQLLILAGAPEEVHQGIKAGEISGAEAVKLVRQHGDQAGEVLAKELERAKAQGKTKVTAGTIKGPAVSRGLLDDLHTAGIKLHSSLPMDARVQIERYHRGEITEGAVAVPLQHLMELHLILEEAQRELAEKELKLREKENKAKQQGLEGVE